MRYLVLSDIHSNLEALEACGARAVEEGYDRVLCCGDIVGYGPDPAAVMDLLDGLQAVCVRGNHDRVVAGLGPATDFSLEARRAVEWTQRKLPDPYRERLARLPQGPLVIDERTELVHGSPMDEDQYLLTLQAARENFALASTRITFFGHTHEPCIFMQERCNIPAYSEAGRYVLETPPGKLFINPGSVGQPRDRDPRAAFLIWDPTADKLEFYRQEYDVRTTQEKMRAVGLPEFLARRLAFGM